MSGVARLIANHRSSAWLKAHQKSGSFPPPALPGLNGTVTLSDTHPDRRLTATLRPRPSPMMGLPRLPGSPSRHAAPTTPMDRNGCTCRLLPHPTRAFPGIQAGRRPSLHFRGLLRLHSRCGLPDCSTAQRRPWSRGFDPAGCPAVPLVSYQSLPTTLWVAPPSTGEPRLWGALNTNGLLTQYFQKGTDLSAHSAADLAAVAATLNGRPRKTLGWRTPAEAFDELLRSAHTAVATTA